jgi:hypothetical protein
MLIEDRINQPPHPETPDEAISQFPATEVEPNEPTPNKFPWKWVIGIIIAIPVSAIALLAGGLFLLSWAIGPDPCGGALDAPANPPKTAPKPGKSL